MKDVNGHDMHDGPRRCPVCDGVGELPGEPDPETGAQTLDAVCRRCDGWGTTDRAEQRRARAEVFALEVRWCRERLLRQLQGLFEESQLEPMRLYRGSYERVKPNVYAVATARSGDPVAVVERVLQQLLDDMTAELEEAELASRNEDSPEVDSGLSDHAPMEGARS